MATLQRIASKIAKLEGGKSQSRIGDIRQILAILKKQHKESRKGRKSWLLLLAKDAGHR